MKRVTRIGLGSLLALGTLPAQTPQTVDGLTLWLDATDGATVQTVGGKVVQWDDKSGFGNHAVQPNPDRQPNFNPAAINGQPGLEFDAIAGDGAFTTNPTDDGMLIRPGTGPADGFSLNRNYSAFLVDRYWGAEQSRTLTNVDASTNWLLGHWNGNAAHFTGAFVGTLVASGTAPLVSSGLGTMTNSSFIKDGRGHGSNTALNNPGRLGIGDDDLITWSEPSQSHVSEVIAFARTLTDTERWSVEDYLANKYAVPQTITRSVATYSTAFTGGDAGEGLDLQGNFVAAANIGGPGGFTIGNATFTEDTGVAAENHIPNWYPAQFGGGTPSANDSNLNTVMQSIRWSAIDGVGSEAVTVNVPNLTPGNTYKLQLLFAENTPNHSRHFRVGVEGDSVMGDFTEAAHRGVNNPNALGNAVVHQFVATDSTLDVVLDATGVAGGDRNPILSGYTLEDRGVTGVATTGTFTSASQLDFSGVFDYALDIGAVAPGASVGDATFTDETAPGVGIGVENHIPAWFMTNLGATPEDDALENIMNSIRWSETLERVDGISLDLDVTPGQAYKLQMLFMEGCCDRGFDVNFEGVLTVDDFSPNALGANVVNNTGAVLSYEFVAPDGQFNILLDGYGTAFADRNPILNALTLERIPEPSAMLLFGLSAGILLRRRRC